MKQIVYFLFPTLLFGAASSAQVNGNKFTLSPRSRVVRKDLAAVSLCHRVSNSQVSFDLVYCEERQSFMVKQTWATYLHLYDTLINEDILPETVVNFGAFQTESVMDPVAGSVDISVHEQACSKLRETYVPLVKKTQCTPEAEPAK